MHFLSRNWESLLLFSLFFSLIFGPAFAVFSEYDFASNPDIRSYIGISNFDFDQNPVRRYRVIVPLLASGLALLFGPIFDLIQPWNFNGDSFSLAFSYLLVNTTILSFTFLLLFRICLRLQVSYGAALLGILCLLSSRWTGYFSGLPWVDSLYLLVIVGMMYSFVFEDKRMLVFSLILGPWAKESFVFFIPLCLYFGPIHWKRQLPIILLSGLLVLGFRFGIDHFFSLDPGESYSRDMEHFAQIPDSLRRLFSFHGVYELFSIVGIWAVFILSLKLKALREIIKTMPRFSGYFLLIILLHALLSTELARMFYIGGLIYVLFMAKLFDHLIRNYFNGKFFSNSSTSDKE